MSRSYRTIPDAKFEFEFKHDRSIGCRTTVVKLMVWAGEPQPDSVKGQKIFKKKDLLRGTLFLADFTFFNLVSIVLRVITLVIK